MPSSREIAADDCYTVLLHYPEWRLIMHVLEDAINAPDAAFDALQRWAPDAWLDDLERQS